MLRGDLTALECRHIFTHTARGEGILEAYLSKAGFEIQPRIASLLPFRIRETSLLTCVQQLRPQTLGLTRSRHRSPITNKWQLLKDFWVWVGAGLELGTLRF